MQKSKSMAIRKLIVEVCSAKNLMPKDSQGTASAYVIVDFDGQEALFLEQWRLLGAILWNLMKRCLWFLWRWLLPLGDDVDNVWVEAIVSGLCVAMLAVDVGGNREE